MNNRPIVDALGLPVGQAGLHQGPPAVLVQFFLSTATLLMQQDSPSGKKRSASEAVEEAWDATKLAFRKLGMQIEEQGDQKKEIVT